MILKGKAPTGGVTGVRCRGFVWVRFKKSPFSVPPPGIGEVYPLSLKPIFDKSTGKK